MSDLIEDKPRRKAWLQYIKRPVEPRPDAAFDWAWFRQQETIEKLQSENSELKRKLDLAKEIDTRILSYLVDHFLMQVANSRKAGMSVEIAIQHFGVDMIKAEMGRRNPTPLVQWATKYLTEIKEI